MPDAGSDPASLDGRPSVRSRLARADGPRPRSRHRHRAGKPWRPAVRAALAWPLAAVAVVALVGARAAQQILRPEEGLLAAEGFILSSTRVEAGAPALSPDGLGALHVAVYAALTRAFTRYDSLAAAGRELMLVAAIGSALLLWRTARRLGLGVLAGAAAVLLAGVPPLLSAAALIDIPAQLAVPWLLLAAWLMAPGRSTVAARVVALVAASLAILLAPDVLVIVLAGAAAALCTGRLLRRVALPRRLIAALLLVPVLALVALLLPRWDPQPGAEAYGVGNGTLLALGAAFLVVGSLAAWSLASVRIPAVALAAATLSALVLQGRFSALTVCLPFAALVSAALAESLLSSAPEGTRRPLRVAASALLAGALITALVLLVRVPPAERATPDTRAALEWAETQLPVGAGLVAPRHLWAELIHVGGDENQVRLSGAGRDGGPSEPAMNLVRGDAPAGGLVVARFERPGARALLVVDPAPGVPTPEELDRRRSLAAALLANPTTGTDGQGAERLRTGAVDQRLLSLLAALGAQFGVGVADFPAAPGEPQSGTLARRALVDRLGDDALLPAAPATERLVAWLDAQLPPFAPDSFEVTDDGVLIVFRYASAPDALVTRSTP